MGQGAWDISQFTLSLGISILSPVECPEKPMGIPKTSLGTV